jgi:lantibiotic modifying enzyme
LLALLALHAALGEPSLLALAALVGDELLGSARESEHGCSWQVRWGRRELALTGLSHGASGIAYALLELYSATGDARYLKAVEGAFSYERRWFSGARGNWADLRFTGNAMGVKQSHFSCYWCHGAPGIALARARAYALLGGALYREEAVAALRTTLDAVASAGDGGTHNFCLCHGVGGNSAVLLSAGHLLEPGATGVSEVVKGVAVEAAARARAGGQHSTFGVEGGAPGLMAGLAGVGLFYLSLHDARTPMFPFIPR